MKTMLKSLQPFNGLFKYSSAGEISFTKEYITWRAWEAEVTVDNIHTDVLSLTLNRNWHRDEACPGDLKELMLDLGTDRPNEAMNFWLELNCEGQWDRIGRYKIDFEFASDAMAYKLTWM